MRLAILFIKFLSLRPKLQHVDGNPKKGSRPKHSVVSASEEQAANIPKRKVIPAPLFINKAISTTSLEHFMAKLLWPGENFSGQVHSSDSNFIHYMPKVRVFAIKCGRRASSSSPGHARSNPYMTSWPPRKHTHTHTRSHPSLRGRTLQARASPLQWATREASSVCPPCAAALISYNALRRIAKVHSLP
jgi:hypothetical protein